MALGGRHFIKLNNNQPKVGVCGGGDIGEGERLWRNVLVVHSAIVWGGEWNDEKINKLKYIMALGGRQSMILHTTINQKQSAMMEGTTDGRREEREVRGKRNTIILRGD